MIVTVFVISFLFFFSVWVSLRYYRLKWLPYIFILYKINSMNHKYETFHWLYERGHDSPITKSWAKIWNSMLNFDCLNLMSWRWIETWFFFSRIEWTHIRVSLQHPAFKLHNISLSTASIQFHSGDVFKKLFNVQFNQPFSLPDKWTIFPHLFVLISIHFRLPVPGFNYMEKFATRQMISNWV